MLWESCAHNRPSRFNFNRASRRKRAISRDLRYEPLEERRLLSIDSPVASYHALHDAPLIVDSTYGVLAGAADPSGAPLSASVAQQPRHGAVALNADGSFRYQPVPGYTGPDSFVFDESDGLGFHRREVARISVLSNWTPSQTATGGGAQPLTSGETVSVSDEEGPEGATLVFTISASGTGPDGDYFMVGPGGATPGQDQRTADDGDFDQAFSGSGVIYGSGSFPVDVQTYDDERDMTMAADAVFGVLATNNNANNMVTDTGVGTILEQGGDAPTCNCDCGCGKTMAGTSAASGAPLAHTSGDSPAPKENYNGGDDPHPIFTAADVLSSSIGSASDLQTQLTVLDDSGAAVYTGSPIYYTASGYTAGATVQFAQQFDAGALADGRYTWHLSVEEDYANTTPIIRGYSGFLDLHNLDQSPYGAGWMLAGIQKLEIQSSGVGLMDDNGNLFFFTQNPQFAGSFTTPELLDGQVTLSQDFMTMNYTLAWKDGSQTVFDPSGLMTSQSDANGNTSLYSHNADGTLATITDPAGRATTFNYTSGKLTSVSDFAGRVTSYGYSGNELTSIGGPDPGHGEAVPSTALGYDATSGLLSSITDSTGTTSLSYDQWRSVTQIKHPDGTYQQFAAPRDQAMVDTSGGLGSLSDPAPLFYASQVDATQTDENGHTTHYVVDSSGRTISTTDPAGNTTTLQYDQFGNLTQMTQPPLTPGGANLVTGWQYDSNSNLIEEDLPDGTHQTWTYDSTFNEPTSYVDPAGRETDYNTIDPNNGNVLSVIQVSAAGNRETDYTYTTGGSGNPPAGLVATIKDPRGIVTAITYNAHGLPTQIVYAQGTADQASVGFSYDTNDNPATYTDELGRVSDMTYDNLNRLIQTILPPPDPNNPSVRPTISAVFDALNNKTSETDPLGNVSTFAYNDSNQLTQVQQPDPAGGTNYTITQYGHDNAGNLTSITDPMSRLTTLGYDADNRQNSVQLPNPVGGGTGGPTSSVVYDALGNVVKSFDFNGAETDYTFDQMGRVLTVTGPAPTPGAARPLTTYTYNADSQVLTMTDPMGHETQYQYDDFGELVQETLPDPDGAGPLTSTVLHWSYDADGNAVSYEDGLNHTTTSAYNDRNWKTSETDPLSGETQYGFDKAGNMTSLTDPAGNATTYVVDGLNRVIQETNQLGYSRCFSYDLNGNLIQETDRDGRVRDFSYDHLNRQTAERWMSGGTVLETISYAYNADGQLTSAASPDSAYAYAYDGEGRTASVENNGTPNVPDVVLSDQYDANGNRTQLSATIAGTADFQDVYTDDALNRLTQLYQQGQTGGNAVATKGANLTYNLLGQLATIARTNFFGIGPAPDIATSTLSYDDANRLTSIAYTTNGGTPIDAYSWSYDLADRVTSMTTTTDGTATYSYDVTNQVTGATQPANESYSFDSNGNRTNTGYSTGTNNQLTSDGTFNYTYDAEGNRVSRTRISNDPASDYLTTYTFDYRNELTDVNFYNNSSVLTKHVHYIYDVFDHLIGKQVDDTGGGSYDRAEFYVYDGNNVALQFGLGGALTERYLNGPSASGVDTVLAEEDVTSLTSPGTVTWPLTDNLGTVRDIVDSTGAVIDHLVYNSFGQVASESAPTVHHLQGYAGGISDPDTGLVNFWERWYDPAVGRWISEDPMEFAANDPNLDRYAGNDVTDLTDPIGLWWNPLGWTSGVFELGFNSWYGNGIFNQKADNLDRKIQDANIKRNQAGCTLGDNFNSIRTMGYSNAGHDAKELANFNISFMASAGSFPKPSLSACKAALKKVHSKVGKLPKGQPGKFGSPQAGTPTKGYRLDPPHPNAAPGSPETGWHINWWDYTGGLTGGITQAAKRGAARKEGRYQLSNRNSYGDIQNPALCEITSWRHISCIFLS